ncbi:MAG: tRNA (N(6)-L-threonylcarbamoyladenosine(37)-C(2))-methylthiotransferase [Methanobacterium sp.]|nr:tRNA (N(6)-L-threonylcarbamoyladenosine(37)-C(2))-methylthiotransferase [Methanobacterium sp.]
MKIYIDTFGCTFNQADSQIMAGLLKENNLSLTSSIEDADVIIINTCYVKHPTEQKVITKIQKLNESFPDKKLIISGCMVEIDPIKLVKTSPNASWIGPHKIQNIVDIVKSVVEGNIIRDTGYSNKSKVGLPKIRSNPLIHIIQICEGCDGACSYCCTRFARGSLQSYSIETIKKEAEQAIYEGCKEIQLTAQDSAAFGKDSGESLPDLMNNITDIEGDFKVRVGMMHPKSMMDDVKEIIKAFKHDKFYKFLHIPIQSGNNKVLTDMNRCHSVEEFKTILTMFKKEIPDISISTDIIVGYPTEDDNAFSDTMKLIQEIKPDFLHISKYKHRPGTSSSNLKEIEYETMKKRSKALKDLKERIAIENNRKFIRTNQRVLVTNKGSKGGYVARTNSYKTVIIENADIGTFSDVIIKDAKPTYLIGSPII